MKVCFPVSELKSLNSEVYGHFGSAPYFLIVETETGESTLMDNQNAAHSKGTCVPIKALGGSGIEGVVVAGIGKGALGKLNHGGITVYKALAPTVEGNLRMLGEGSLPVFVQEEVCKGHGQGCSHGA